MRRYVPSDQSLPHSSSRFRCAPFWTHSPGLSLVPVPQILASTFSVFLRGKLLLPQPLLQSKGSVRAALWGFRLLRALPNGPSLWKHETIGDPLNAHQMCVGVYSPWGSSGSGRKEPMEKLFLLSWRDLGGNNFLALSKDFQADWEISLSENYGQLESTLVMVAIPPSLFPFFLVFYFITIKCQNLWQKYLLCPRTPGLKHSPINCSCPNNAGLNPKNV